MIENRILKGLLSNFSESFGFKALEESKQFEHLCSYSLLSKIDPDAFSDPAIFGQLDVDSSGTFGVDSVAIFINNSLVTSEEDIAAQRKSKRLDVRFVFIQVKASSGIDAGDLLKFTSAVENLFKISPDIQIADDLRRAKELIDQVFSPENARLFGQRRPVCELYFVNAGPPVQDSILMGLMKQREDALRAMVAEIGSASIRHVGADGIIDAYSEIENRFQVMLSLDRVVPCDEIGGVVQAFIGFVSAAEFLRLIEASDGSLRRHVFYENVRDFQGADNSVNGEIAETLADESMRDKFVLLNNGITVVARDFKNLRASEYEISDYFIVNGCQTSHMIFQHREAVREQRSLKVPIKIIHTNSNDIIASIIRSTNRQTPVPDEAFASLEKFHKRLQDYYHAFPSDAKDRLFYERRSKEYSSSGVFIERPRIVNLHAQIRAFASVMLGEPQIVMSRNPSTILKDHEAKLFVDGHKYSPYFAAAFILFRLQALIASGRIDSRFVYAKYWIGWIARMIALQRVDLGPLSARHLDSECEGIVTRFSDDDYSFRVFDAACETFGICRDAYLCENKVRSHELVRLRQFRDHVRSYVGRELDAVKV